MPSWSILAWWIGTAGSFGPAMRSVGHLISASRGLLSKPRPAPCRHHQAFILVRDELASQSARSSASVSRQARATFANPFHAENPDESGKRWPSSRSRNVAMLKA